MDVNNMIAAMAAKTVDAMINIEPYNAIMEADGLGTNIVNLEKYDNVPVFMAATSEIRRAAPRTTIVAYLKAWLDIAKDFKDNPKKVSDVIYSFFTSEGLQDGAETFAQGDGHGRGGPGLSEGPRTLHPYITPRRCSRKRKISASRTSRRCTGPALIEEGPRPGEFNRRNTVT